MDGWMGGCSRPLIIVPHDFIGCEGDGDYRKGVAHQ